MPSAPTAFNLKGLDVGKDGIDPNELENILKTDKKVKLIYLIPTFQNPAGITMSLEKRKTVLALAKKYGVVILEDNPYGELRFAGTDIPTIKSMDDRGCCAVLRLVLENIVRRYARRLPLRT